MTYYKLIDGKTFVGIATQLDFRNYQHKHNILLSCDESKAEYVQCKDTYYRADWMLPTSTDRIEYKIVKVIQIDEEEYNALYNTISKGEEVEIPPEQEIVPEEPTINPDEEVTVDFVKNSKLNEISSICNKTITDGFDVVLSDGQSHHFSLTLDDQANLSTLSADMIVGSKTLPYHADGEECQFFSVEDMTKIITTAKEYKTYHITYFNSLKLYILSLDDINVIGSIEYGDEIPNENKSEVLLTLEQQLNDNSTNSDGDTSEEN